SSRRRHTRFSRDWSSDVCSSDLKAWNDLKRGGFLNALTDEKRKESREMSHRLTRKGMPRMPSDDLEFDEGLTPAADEWAEFRDRSEERRVGKGGRCRGVRWMCIG